MDLNGQILPYGSPIPVGAYNYSLAPAPLPQQGQPGQPQQGQPQQGQPGQPQQAQPSPLSPQQMSQMMAPAQPSGLSAMMMQNRAIPRMSSGGNTSEEEEKSDTYIPTNSPRGPLTAKLTKGRTQYVLSGLPE